MAEFKIAIGFEIDANDKQRIQNIIDDIRSEKPEVKVKINTEQALKDIKTLQKELKKLKDVSIKIKTVHNSTTTGNKVKQGVNDYLSADTNNVSWKTSNKNKNKNTSYNNNTSYFNQGDVVTAREVNDAYNEIIRTMQRLSTLRSSLEKKKPFSSQREIDVVNQEIERLYKYGDALQKTYGEYFSDKQIFRINETKIQSKFNVSRASAQVDDKTEIEESNNLYKSLISTLEEIGETKVRIAKLNAVDDVSEITLEKNKLEQLSEEYDKAYHSKERFLTVEQKIGLSNIRAKYDDKVANVESQKYELANKITGNFDISQGGTGGFTTDISNLITRMSQLSNVSNEVKADINQLRTLVDTMVDANDIGDIDKLISSYNEYNTVIEKVDNSLKELKNKQRVNVNDSNLDFKKTKLGNDIDIWLQKNSNAARDFGYVLEQIKSQIQSADKIKLDKLQQEFTQVKQEAQLAGKTGLTFGDTIKKQWEQMRGYFTLYDVYSYAKQGLTSMFQEVVKVDTAMSGLYRVTDLTTAQYESMYDGMTASAKEYGLVLSDLIDGTTNWAKLGFDGKQASELAEISSRYQVVADTDNETAVGNLVTAYKGFQDELSKLYDGDSVKAVEYVSDIFNKIGNEFAIDAENVGLGLTKSASALNVAGNTIQESVGMLTAVSEITNAPERAGNMLKILSLRLRGKHKFRYNLDILCLHTRKVRMLCCIL